jgi:mono/diheme cytochrome c family protein
MRFLQVAKRVAQVASRRTLSQALLAVLLGLPALRAEEDPPSLLERRGHALAERMCAQCHAIDKSGSSPHSAAPTFREISRRVDLDRFANRLRDGLISGHPDMPTFRFTREDARALIAYLRSIQGP